mgnify:CR=1 FL=1
MTAYLLTGARPLGADPVDILLADGEIRALGSDARSAAPADLREVDATGLVALPGLGDLHTPLREPGFADGLIAAVRDDQAAALSAASAASFSTWDRAPSRAPGVSGLDTK